MVSTSCAVEGFGIIRQHFQAIYRKTKNLPAIFKAW